ncbi:MAG: glycoside hydrolase family 127 protein [Bacteroidaceae bacterium]|nr:glycoside hydrolase family 127 protein [Bacteroidaceae bacterium]
MNRKSGIRKALLALALWAGGTGSATAQSQIYPQHFNLSEVTLLDGPMRTAMLTNARLLMQYDVDRLLTPYVRQSGLAATTDTKSKYYQWEQRHPSFPNWGGPDFNLDGHVGGHYLSALALASAALHDDSRLCQQLRERMEYMLDIMADCQQQYAGNTKGLRGFIGGQPINDVWTTLYSGNISALRSRGGWVPFYCEHKILAGLRDAYLYGGSEKALELFRNMADWSVNVVARVSDADMESMLGIEHGGMNESMLDAYQLFGDKKYLTAAKKYSHRMMLDGMQTLATTFLDGKHANTQVPKYIGFERIGEQDAAATNYLRAAQNFWTDVAQNRTVCIGGNSVSEHFLSRESSNRYIDILDGPESCNSNNMLKLTEMLADRTIAEQPKTAARYADFYEGTMWNHILSTQDPQTGGYVYFTTLRPQGYRIYSQVNQGMWCCVGTGMENHSKYGHFIYTHDGVKTLYVNLFTPSELFSEHFGIRQETLFPFIDPTDSNLPTPFTATSTLTVTRGGTYRIALRHPAWAGKEYSVTVNGEAVNAAVTKGTASYVTIDRTWSEGDQIRVFLPMELRYEVCPNYTDYIAFRFGPILLAAQTTAQKADDGSGLPYEQLQNEYAGAGRMDHAPGNMASSRTLTSAPLLIGKRSEVLKRIQPSDLSRLEFLLDASRPEVASYQWGTLKLQPFYAIHHARYQCYWYQQTEEAYAASDMAKTEAQNEALKARTLDFVAPGEQQSEAGHEYKYSSDSGSGYYRSEQYRDAQSGGYVQYTLFNPEGVRERLSVMCRFTTADRGRRATLTVDGKSIADITIPATHRGTDSNGFFNIEYPIPESLMVNADGSAKAKFVVRLAATGTTPNPGLYYLRLMKEYDDHAYQFHASDWTTGDINRLAAGNIAYDSEANTLTIRSSGANNVCLSLDHARVDYTLARSQTCLVVRGTGLRQTDGSSYLWWLNGTNHASQVKPTRQTTLTRDGVTQQVIAWDITQSGLYDNFTDPERNSICMGATIFGLTAKSSTTPVVIYDINFVEDLDQYIAATTPVVLPVASASESDGLYYTISGQPVAEPRRGIYVRRGQKVVVQE